MRLQKKNIIAQFNDEVGELHPFLKALFKRMSGIISVEYTHGANEMGADFVLARQDEILGRIEYISVVCKTKQIKQDFDDVRRQIEESFVVERLKDNNSKIYVSSVWVLTTKNITKNAKEKIYSIFKGHNVVFIDGDNIIKFVDKYYQEYWNVKSIDVFEYFKNARDNILKMDKDCQIIFSDEHLYVKQDVELCKPYGEIKELSVKKRKKIDMQKEAVSAKISFLQGEMGFGKTKLLHEIALHYLTESVYDETHVIPFFCTFEDFIIKYNKDIDRIVKKIGVKNDEGENIYLLLIDSVDEVNFKNINSDYELSDCITVINNYTNNKVSAVFSMRYFPLASGLNDVLQKTPCYQIKQFSFSNIIELVKTCVNVDTQSRFFEDLKQSSLFKEMPKSPIAALLLAKVLLKQGNHDLPSSMTELYAKYTEIVLGRWDVEKGIKNEIEYSIADRFVTHIARYFLKNEQFEISRIDMLNMLNVYLKERNRHNVDPEKIVDALIKDSGILILDYAGNIKFKHRTFLDFFLAKGYREQNSLKISSDIYSPFWSNIYYFYIGLMSGCPDVLDKIVELQPKTEQERWGKIFFSAQYFLAAFMTPYKYVEKYIPTVFLDAALLYNDINNKKDMNAVNLPRGILLFFLLNVMKTNFSYNFFKNAISLAYLTIDEDNCDEKVKITALFMLALVNNCLNSREELKSFVDNYCHKLDIDILTIAKIEDDKSKSLCFKKMSKRLQSMARTPLFEKKFKELFQLPKIKQIS